MKKYLLSTIALTATLLFIGCGSSTKIAEKILTIKSTDPANNAKNISVLKVLTVVFDDEISQEKAKESFSLFKKSDKNAKVNLIITSIDKKTYTIGHIVPFDRNTTYEFRINSDVKVGKVKLFKSDYVLNFTTEK